MVKTKSLVGGQERIGNLKVISTEICPGLEDQLEQLAQAGRLEDPAKAEPTISLNDFIRLNTETGVQWSERTYDLFSRKMDYADWVNGGGLSRLLNRFRKYRVLDEREFNLEMPVAELHHPGVKGTSAWLEHTVSREIDYTASLKFLGFGGGRGVTIKAELTQKALLTEPGCVTLTIPIAVKAQIRQTEKGKSPYVDIQSIVGGGLGTRQIEKKEDECRRTVDEVKGLGWQIFPYHLERGIGSSTQMFKAGSEHGFKGSAGFEFGGTGITLECSAKWQDSVTYGYELKMGRVYFGFKQNYMTGLMWCKT